MRGSRELAKPLTVRQGGKDKATEGVKTAEMEEVAGVKDTAASIDAAGMEDATADIDAAGINGTIGLLCTPGIEGTRRGSHVPSTSPPLCAAEGPC